jgi:hypothetical protein
MPWYVRGKQKYYMHVYMDSDGRLRSLYCGGGARGEAAAAHYEAERAERKGRVARRRECRERLAEQDRKTNYYCKCVDELHDAFRRASGWHKIGTRWRRTGVIDRRTVMSSNLQSFEEAARARQLADTIAVAGLDAALKLFDGDMAKTTIDMFVCQITDDPVRAEALRLKVGRLAAELQGDDASPTVRALAERVSVCYIYTYYSDQLSQANDDRELVRYLQSRQNQALRRFTHSVRALAECRRIEASTVEAAVRRFKVIA